MLAPHRASGLAPILGGCRRAIVGLALMSGLVNLLYLTGSFFMLQVYDRVIPSRSVPTLIGLSVLALALYAFQGGLEILRARTLVRVGGIVDEALGPRVFDAAVRAPLVGTMPGDGLLPVRDLDALRSFLSGPAPGALFDLPWIPFYVGICCVFHPLIGIAALLGGAALVALTLLTERLTRAPTREASGLMARRNGLIEAGRRNAESLAALGMRTVFMNRWSAAGRDYRALQQVLADVGGGFGAASKVFRLALQSGVLALGAYLVIEGEASSGVIIAGSILVSRALAPIELAIANWRSFVGARQSWTRLESLFAALPPQPERQELPPPCRTLRVQSLSLAPPSIQRVVLHDIGFALEAGDSLGIIGPSASGKSSLMRAVVGVWAPMRGSVRLDGATLDQWSSTALGRHIGYLPQDVELFDGTIAENIARFQPDAAPEAIIAAAQAAGFHEAILGLPDGYNALIGDRGARLSAGQRQRVGLARALYDDPFLVVLDEPNANLDSAGEAALAAAMLGVRRRGGIVVVATHRPNVLSSVDLILALADGHTADFGPKDEVLRRLLRTASVPPAADAAGTAKIRQVRV
ncbi:type I secretion system permease/ATPase [Methylorubrum sp. POS3]|uniref:type I secretion system permease/ATPase n=1 Tax=Methylorubrum sp. POS3 TaxID=2998492 RepID=UPI003728EA02